MSKAKKKNNQNTKEVEAKKEEQKIAEEKRTEQKTKEERRKEIQVDDKVIEFAKDLVEATIKIKKPMNGSRPAILNDYMPITKKTSTYQIAEYILNLYEMKRKK